MLNNEAQNATPSVLLSANACKGYVRCVGTIVTGPALVAAAVLRRPRVV